MIIQHFWAFGFNIIVNSVLSFLTSFCILTALMWVLRIKAPRMRSILLMIPILKLVADLFLYDFSSWSFLHQVNPLEATEGSRELSISLSLPFMTGIQLLLQDGKTFTLADLLLFYLEPFWIKTAVIISSTVSIALISKNLLQLFISARNFTLLKLQANVCCRTIKNKELQAQLKKTGAGIFTSSNVDVPCALGIVHKNILFPEKLMQQLTQQEFEAIVAHELNHLQWHDGLIRSIALLIQSLFWWVPINWCRMALEQLQEQACDKKVDAFRLSRVALASAILKTAQAVKANSTAPVTAFAGSEATIKRIRLLANYQTNNLKSVRLLQTLVISIIAAAVAVGKFWIF